MEQNGMERKGMEWNEKGYIVFIYSVIIVRNTQLTIRYMYHSIKNIIESKREKDRESLRK